MKTNLPFLLIFFICSLLACFAVPTTEKRRCRTAYQEYWDNSLCGGNVFFNALVSDNSKGNNEALLNLTVIECIKIAKKRRECEVPYKAIQPTLMDQ